MKYLLITLLCCACTSIEEINKKYAPMYTAEQEKFNKDYQEAQEKQRALDKQVDEAAIAMTVAFDENGQPVDPIYGIQEIGDLMRTCAQNKERSCWREFFDKFSPLSDKKYSQADVRAVSRAWNGTFIEELEVLLARSHNDNIKKWADAKHAEIADMTASYIKRRTDLLTQQQRSIRELHQMEIDQHNAEVQQFINIGVQAIDAAVKSSSQPRRTTTCYQSGNMTQCTGQGGTVTCYRNGNIVSCY